MTQLESGLLHGRAVAGPVMAIALLAATTGASLASTGLGHGVPLCRLGDCGLKPIPPGAEGLGDRGNLARDRPDLSGVAPQHGRTAAAKGSARHPINGPLGHRNGRSVDQIHASQAAESRMGLPPATGGNLPDSYRGVSWTDFEASDRAVMVTPQVGAKLKGLRTGDVLPAMIEDEIEVWPGKQSPVRAFLMRGPYKGSWASGQATLDSARKKIMIALDRLRLADGSGAIYSMKAEVRAPTGRYGLEGNYHSESGKFFIAEVFASAAAGFTDATIQRNQNVQGNYVQEPSVANAARAGAATALSRRADRWSKQEEQAPEWTELDGFHEVQIFIESDPVEDNG